MTVYLRAHDVTLELPLDVQRVSEGGAGRYRAALGGAMRRYTTVLSRLEFSAVEGDRIALIGLNGAGKTTLLRVLNGAFAPTQGVVRRNGTMQSLLNASLGFSEYATVIENVLLRGTAMGLRRRQLQATMTDILEFSGLRDRALHRLNTLSAGQRTRLGFAISTAIQPDILLMDEWLATGDAAFIDRAQERMRDRFRGSRIVVLASHSSELQRQLCNKALVIDAGKMRYYGDIDEGLAIYREVVSSASAKLREHSAAHDPLLLGDVHGFVERIKFRRDGIEVEGWAIGDKGTEIDLLRVELDGQQHLLDRFERIGRDDVLRVTSRKSGRYGFRFLLPSDAAICPDSIGVRLSVSVGSVKSRLSYPLQMAVGTVIEAA